MQSPDNASEEEARRVKALADYKLAGTDPQPEYDAITRLAAYICGTPISLITLLDHRTAWVKSRAGIDVTEVPREIAMCNYTIGADQINEIPDLRLDKRFEGNPLVEGEANVRFYAGAPLITPDGYRLGSLCVIDHVARNLTDDQRDALRILAREVISHMEVTKKNRELQESLARHEELSTMFDNSNELHCIIAADGAIDMINPAVVDILGYTVEEVLGQNIWNFAVDDVRPKILAHIEKVGPNGSGKIDFEMRIRNRGGELRWISWNAVIKRDKWFANGRDITDQKKLLEEMEQLSVVANKVTSGVVISDSKNDVIWVNDAFEKITGFSRDDVAGRKLGDVIKGKDTDEKTITTAREYNRNKKSFHVELLAYRKDGEPVWLSVMNSVILNENDEFDKVVEIITDITTRKKYEDQLETLSMASSQSSSGIFVRQADGVILWFNEAFERITGYSLDQLEGKKFGEMLLGPDSDRNLYDAARKAVLERKPYEVEIQIYRKDGTPLWVFISNNPQLNEEGNVERQVGVVVDISGRKKVEHELIKTREEALQLSRAKEMFVSVMSHEIRTPLNAVIGMAHILREDDPTPSQLEHLDILKFSAENLLSLLNGILDYTKIETGNVALEATAINLRELVTRTMDSFLFKAKEKGIALRYEIDHGIPDEVIGDQTRLYQVLINLIGNSIKFTHEGSVKLRLNLVSDTAEKIAVQFSISDTGIGIAKDKVDYIFEAYTQAKSDTTRKYGGTGLGLAITKRLIDLFGSSIQVQSEEGKGSDFIFTIAFKKVGNAKRKDQKENFRTFDKKVLVVDDNDINRLLARKVLSKWGIEADMAENGRIAVQKILENRYDLVLMDIHMPEMDGFEAVKMVRNQPDEVYRKLPIIALTASILSSELNEISEAGMNDYVQKPFAPNDLYRKIEKYL